MENQFCHLCILSKMDVIIVSLSPGYLLVVIYCNRVFLCLPVSSSEERDIEFKSLPITARHSILYSSFVKSQFIQVYSINHCRPMTDRWQECNYGKGLAFIGMLTELIAEEPCDTRCGIQQSLGDRADLLPPLSAIYLKRPVDFDILVERR
jgi:hypothetical protein